MSTKTSGLYVDTVFCTTMLTQADAKAMYGSASAHGMPFQSAMLAMLVKYDFLDSDFESITNSFTSKAPPYHRTSSARVRTIRPLPSQLDSK